MIKNILGRELPEEANGLETVPYMGVGKFRPAGKKTSTPIATCADFPADGNKVVPSLRDALGKCGLRDGMTISTHHHFRNGDKLANAAFDVVSEMGVKDVVFYPSALFPVHNYLKKHLESGVIHHIEGSLNGPLGEYCSRGKMRGMGVLRSHGGRYQSIQDGEVHVDVALIAAPTADPFGNATGDRGPSACGLLGFALADAQYADKVVVVTDNLVDFPCVPFQIHGNWVDHVVVVDSVGDPSKIVSGTTEVTKSPDRLYIAELTARFIRAAGIMKDGFSMQAGAGGTNLAFAVFLRDLMRKEGVKARFIRGGSTRYLVEMLEEGLTDFILDGQTFDLAGVESIRNHPNRHVTTSPFTSYNYHSKGSFCTMIDVSVLGATEVDLDFNANVVSHSDGILQHGLGGWPNCLLSKCTILSLPAFRDRIPVIVDRVTTVCGPGELVDVVVTERGIAINPRRSDLLEAVKGSGLPVRPLAEIQREVEGVVGGKPDPVKWGDRFVAVVKWVDGTTIDALREVK